MHTYVRLLAATILAAAASVPSCGATHFSNVTVHGVRMYGNGTIAIWIATPISQANCAPNATHIDVRASDPNIKEILAIATSAVATAMPIWGQVNGSDPDYGMPTSDQSYQSWTGLQPAS